MIKSQQKRKVKKKQKLSLEKKFLRQGFVLIIGVDEAGRGPLAGPVFAGAVAILGLSKMESSFNKIITETDDSKRLSSKKRNALFKMITGHRDIIWGKGKVSNFIIDRINILEASKMAMVKAVSDLLSRLKKRGISAGRSKTCLIIDGNFLIDFPVKQWSMIRADERVFSVSAASIIAKVSRDRLMEIYDKKYPGYGFKKHKGYPTAGHIAAIKKLGILPIHRRTFAPVSRMCDNLIKKGHSRPAASGKRAFAALT